MGRRSEFNDAIATGCLICSPGSYSIRADKVSMCKPCPAGYVCVQNTSSATPVDPDKDGGYECPKGNYCPEGSYEPTPCPAGYFGQKKKAENESTCAPCEAGFYNDLEGQSGCKPCGPSSSSALGATTCKCEGANRVFQKMDGKCVCKQYYTSVLEGDEEDSKQDCRPLLLDRCSGNYMRDSFGKCVPQDSCESECKGGKGKRTPGMGMCECESIQDPDAVCNETCRAQAPKMLVNTKGEIVFENKSAINMTSMQYVAGEPQCTSGSCQLISLSMATKGGFSANYQPSSKILGAYKKLRLLSDQDERRLLETSNGSISNPVVCIKVGDTVSFDVKSNSYPVYLKDAMANSNPDFDYSKFVELETRYQSGETIEMFMFTFGQAGVYVFGDKADLSQQSVFSVMDKSQNCPNSGKYIVPITASNLLQMGIKQNEDVTLVPDWIFIGCCFIVLLLLIPGIIVCISYFHNKASEAQMLTTIAFKKKEPKTKAGAQTGVSKKQQTEEELVGMAPHVIDLEKAKNEDGEVDPSIFESIYSQLRNHAAYVKAEFEKKSGQDKTNITNVWKQIKELKEFMKKRLKEIAKIFGKNVKYMLSKKRKPEAPGDKQFPMEEKKEEELAIGLELIEGEGAEASKAEKAALKEAIASKEAADAQELQQFKEQGKEKDGDFVKMYVDVQNRKLEDFKEKVLENSKLSEGDKTYLLKEYEKQLQQLQKQMLVDQSEQQNQITLRIASRKAKRQQLLTQKERLAKEKEDLKARTEKLLGQIGVATEARNSEINAEIDREIQAAEQQEAAKAQASKDILKVKFEKKLKNTANPQQRAQFLEEFERDSRELERIFEEAKEGQLRELKMTLERRRKERKDTVTEDAKAEANSIVDFYNKQTERIREEEGLIFNELANVVIDEKVNEATEATNQKSREEEERLEQLRQAHKADLQKLEEEERAKIDALREEQRREEERLRGENEKLRAQQTAAVKRSCEDINEERKQLRHKLESSSVSEEARAQMQKQLQALDEQVRKRLEDDAKRQDADFTARLAERRKAKQQKEAAVLKESLSKRLALQGQHKEAETAVERQNREERFKRTAAELTSRLSDEELPIALDKLIEAKHMEALSDLLSTQFREKARVHSEKMGELIEAKLQEMQAIKEELEQQYQRLKAGADKEEISQGDYQRRFRELQERESDKLRDIELKYIELGNELEQRICEEQGCKNQDQLLALREEQFLEKKEIMGNLAKSNRYARALMGEDSSNTLADELQEYRRQLDEEKQRKMKELDDRRQRLQAIAVENEAQVQLFNEETQKLLDTLALREREKVTKKKEELEEAKRRRQSAITLDPRLNDEEKRKLMEDYNTDIETLIKTMEAEQKRQNERMMKKLEAKLREKEKVKTQKQLQLILYNNEFAAKMESQLREKEIKLDTKVEAKDSKAKVAALNDKAEKAKAIFYKQKFAEGIELSEELKTALDHKLPLAQDKDPDQDQDFEGTLLNIDFDDLLRSIVTLKTNVSAFTDKQFNQLMDGFRTINSKLNELRAKALSRGKR